MSLSRFRLPFNQVVRICSISSRPIFSSTHTLYASSQPIFQIHPDYSSFLISKRLEGDLCSTRNSVVFYVEDDDEFTEKVIESSTPVLVDFYADWCGPCRLLGPRLEAKVKGYEGALLLAKIDVDCASDLAMQYEVNAVPTVIGFKNGEVIERMEGDHGDDYLDKLIQQLMA